MGEEGAEKMPTQKRALLTSYVCLPGAAFLLCRIRRETPTLVSTFAQPAQLPTLPGNRLG